LHTAIKQKRLWQQQGLFDDKRLAVNLSPHQIERGKVIENLLRIAGDECDNTLELEITETAVMQDVRHVAKILSAITERGIRVAIDDFGIGYSSLSKLKSLPISILKIDRSFVRDIAHDKNDAAIVKAIITMAQTLDLSVVAEGVESEAHREMLMSYQCPQAQGFHFSKPVSADAARCLLLEQHEKALL
jgi:EAL domain-containing protein (putative c-di-GMP-specific phosphodiesterase class I)